MKVTIIEEQCGIQCKANHFESESDFLYWYNEIIIITEDVMIMIVNNVDSTRIYELCCYHGHIHV